MAFCVAVLLSRSVSILIWSKQGYVRCEVGYTNSEKEPELVFVGQDEAELTKIARMVEKLNADLVDSGFDQYRYDLEVKGDKAYIKRL